MTVTVFHPVFNQVIYFLIVEFHEFLYMLDTSASSDASLANIFFQSLAYLLLFLTLSFTERKLLISVRSSFSILSFTNRAFDPCLHTQSQLGFLLF